MGKKHETKYKEGDRINDSFTLVKNYSKKTKLKGRNLWLWDCKCDCGNEFHCREDVLINRYGCHSCTNKKTSTETALKKKNGIIHAGLKNRLLKDYRVGASRRGMEFNLTFEEFVKLVEQNCFYCGAKPELHEYELQYMQKTQKPWLHNGIDRIDSSKGYTIDNVVPCCSKCNYAKHEMTTEEFKKWLQQIYKYFILNEKEEEKETEDSIEKETNFRKFPQFDKYRNKKQ